MMHDDTMITVGRNLVPGGHPFFTALVLAEADDDMWLATVVFSEPPQPGSTFHFRGEVWEVVWREDFGCRAEPAVM